MWIILYPFRYFRLENDAKRHIDLFPTIIIAFIFTIMFMFFPSKAYFAPNGFLDKVLLLTVALTGFYVVALVAAATFIHPDLDKIIKAGSVVLLQSDANGKLSPEPLTRREFVCLIFGYLAFSALAFSIVASIAISLDDVSPSIPLYGDYLRIILTFLFSLWISHIFVVTSLGLYYLMDRLYRRDRQIITKKDSSDRAA